MYVEESLRGIIEDASLYHKSVQFNRNFIVATHKNIKLRLEPFIVVIKILPGN